LRYQSEVTARILERASIQQANMPARYAHLWWMPMPKEKGGEIASPPLKLPSVKRT
jgi:hypothetical protein